MHTIADILTTDRIFTQITGSSKKRILQDASDLIAESNEELIADEVFDRLIAREKLGSTGFGNGVAIPHCRLMNCSDVVGAFIRLDSPVGFDSVDRKPVDLLFVLLVPEQANDTHLNILSILAEKFSDASFLKALRSASSPEKIRHLLIN